MPKIIADEQIYQAAIQTVIERGYSGATTKHIAEVAKISEVTLFRKYGNKAELVKQAISAMAERIDLTTAATYTGDVKADLLRVAQTYQGSAETSGQFFYTILLELSRYPELADVIDTPIGMVQMVAQLMSQYQEAGVLKQENPMHAVAGLLGPLIATNIIRAAAKVELLPPIDLDEHVEGFLNGRLH